MATAALTPRGRCLRHLTKHRGITEDPSGSNSDHRRWGIRHAQINCAAGGQWLVGTPWCGTWAFWAMQHGGVAGIGYRQASVRLIEDDARAHRAPFSAWLDPGSWRDVQRCDLAVMFARGVHVETIRYSFVRARRVYIVTDGGNTSSGVAGSQSDGGGAFRRVRMLSEVHGFARVRYPGAAALDAALAPATLADGWLRRDRASIPTERVLAKTAGGASDDLLMRALERATEPRALDLLEAIAAA